MLYNKTFVFLFLTMNKNWELLALIFYEICFPFIFSLMTFIIIYYYINYYK